MGNMLRNRYRNRQKAALLAIAIAIAIAVSGTAIGCGKVPAPAEIVADKSAERKKNLCLAWQYGGPRKTLTDAATGGAEQKLLGEFLSPTARDDDPDELKDALAKLSDSARRLKDGDDPTKVLADSEAALATTDRFYEASCPALIAEDRATTTTA